MHGDLLVVRSYIDASISQLDCIPCIVIEFSDKDKPITHLTRATQIFIVIEIEQTVCTFTKTKSLKKTRILIKLQSVFFIEVRYKREGWMIS